MTIKTLELIHKLLIAEEKRAKEVYSEARKLQYEYEDQNADQEMIDKQEIVAYELMRQHSAAVDALRDFEEREW